MTLLPFGLRPHSSKVAAITPILSVKPLVLNSGEGHPYSMLFSPAAKKPKPLKRRSGIDEKFQARAEQLAEEFAGSATTIGELNQLMRTMMKAGLERRVDSM